MLKLVHQHGGIIIFGYCKGGREPNLMNISFFDHEGETGCLQSGGEQIAAQKEYKRPNHGSHEGLCQG